MRISIKATLSPKGLTTGWRREIKESVPTPEGFDLQPLQVRGFRKKQVGKDGALRYVGFDGREERNQLLVLENLFGGMAVRLGIDRLAL